MNWRLAVCLCCVAFPLSRLGAQDVQQPASKLADSPEAVIIRAGGVVSHDQQDRVIGLQFPENLTLPDHAWRALEKLTDLRELDLSAMLVTNDRLQNVGKLTNLRSLNLFGNPIDSVAIENLIGLQKLETLYLYRTFVDDEAVLSLNKLGRHTVDGSLKCIDWKTGQIRWKQKVADRGSLIFADGCFINLGENGLVTLFKATPDGYAEIGRIDGAQSGILPSYPAWTAPVLSHGRLYLRGKHEVICYDLTKSQETKLGP